MLRVAFAAHRFLRSDIGTLEKVVACNAVAGNGEAKDVGGGTNGRKSNPDAPMSKLGSDPEAGVAPHLVDLTKEQMHRLNIHVSYRPSQGQSGAQVHTPTEFTTTCHEDGIHGARGNDFLVFGKVVFFNLSLANGHEVQSWVT